MKNRNNYFNSKFYVSIFFIDVMGNERQIFDLDFPLYRKDKYGTAKARLEEFGFSEPPKKIEWLNAWQGRKKRRKKMMIRFN